LFALFDIELQGEENRAFGYADLFIGFIG